jgi:hypothetical protein
MTCWNFLLDVAPSSRAADDNVPVALIIITLIVVFLLTAAALCGVLFIFLVWRKRWNRHAFSLTASEIEAVTGTQPNRPNQP